MSDTDLVQGAVVKHLNALSGQLTMFLERVLPPLFDKWWEQAVMNSLSSQQQRRLRERSIYKRGFGIFFV